MEDKQSNINPNFKRQPFVKYDADACKKGIQEKDYKILSYLISKCESTLAVDRAFIYDLIQDLQPNHSVRKIAISGSPGVGKSTFINSFAKHLNDQNKSIAILPVDPSSSISRGSILGDKTRMEDIVTIDNVFIKPMPSSLSLGGVAPSSFVASYICELAGFDYVFIETVGVGQSEIEVRYLVDMFVLLLQPGGGDDLQGIKRGIMEIADLLVVNKADGSLLNDAKRSLEAYKQALKLLLPNDFGWKAKVCLHSSVGEHFSTDCVDVVEDYFSFMQNKNALAELRKEQKLNFFDSKYKEYVLRYLQKDKRFFSEVDKVKTNLNDGNILLFQALKEIDTLLG